jgi:ABC-2 type transport system ATP-binding protein
MPAIPTHRDADLAVLTSGLRKRFGDLDVLNGIDVSIPRGSVYAVLGPNGAGKTTLIRVLATLLRPDAGTVQVLGHDVRRDAAAIRRRISLTAQFASVDEDLTAEENLVLLARLRGCTRRRAHARADELLDAFELGGAARRRVGRFSGGMRRRLDLAASILTTPDLLFLDEPTTGLDPHIRNQLWQLIRLVVAHGTTVLLTTQYLEEADQLADRIAVLDHGSVIAEGSRAELKASASAGQVRIRLHNPNQRPEAARLLTAALGVPATAEPDPAMLTTRMPPTGQDSTAALTRALGEFTRAGVRVADFAFGQPSLDEVFLALTGHRTDTRPDSSIETEHVA